MKPVSVSYWNDELKQMEVTILQQPDPIDTVAFSISFEWMPNVCGCIPELKDYKLHTFVLYNIDFIAGAKLRKFDAMELMVKNIKDACFGVGVIIDPDYLRLMPMFGKDMGAKE